MSARKLKAAPMPAKPIRLDLGCGPNKVAPEWTGIDSRAFPGVDVVLNLVQRVHEGGCITHVSSSQRCDCDASRRDAMPPFAPWPWADGTIEEAHSSHFVEHLTAPERIHFVNELHRVLKPGATCKIIVPHWASCRAYGDLTHQWPPVSEFWFYYLSKAWREANAPHNDGYTCDFDFTAGYSMRQDLAVRAAEYQQFALGNYKEAAQDIIATLTKRAP